MPAKKIKTKRIQKVSLGLSPALKTRLCCPVDKSALSGWAGKTLKCEQGHRYDLVEGVPVLTVSQGKKGYWGMEWDKNLKTNGIDPFVAQVIGATGGYLYLDRIGDLERYPIPQFRFPAGNGKLLLDIGCNWGRWCIAAAKEGYTVVGMDPHLDAVLAAKRVAKQLGVEADFIVADARYLPFKAETFDVVFSYSVLQHFAKDDVAMTAKEVGRCLKRNGESHIQMANALGLRSFYHQARRGFKEPTEFLVRYWTPGELRHKFQRYIGETELSIDGFLSVNLQETDLDLLPWTGKVAYHLSRFLTRLARVFHPVETFADSLYVNSTKI